MKRKLSHRLALAWLTLAPTAALAGAAGEPDPVFTIIEKHREAYRKWGDALAISNALEAETFRGQRRRDDSAFIDAQARADSVGDIACDLRRALIETKPITLAGVVAVIRYFESCDLAIPSACLLEDEESRWEFIMTIGDAIEAMLDKGAIA
jgi:hypothetical protein